MTYREQQWCVRCTQQGHQSYACKMPLPDLVRRSEYQAPVTHVEVMPVDEQDYFYGWKERELAVWAHAQMRIPSLFIDSSASMSLDPWVNPWNKYCSDGDDFATGLSLDEALKSMSMLVPTAEETEALRAEIDRIINA